MKSLLLSTLLILVATNSYAQGCCSGGSGSPIAGGTSQGVLAERQMELGMNFQYISSKKFLTGNQPSDNYYIKDFNTKYLYYRMAYGVTSKFTLSIETGYFLNKTQVPLNGVYKEIGKGFADLIIFPRYKIYEHNTEETRDEITLGLGMKIPLGKYYDSTWAGNVYIPSAPAVLTTTGSNDFIFYGFAFRGYPEKKARVFMNLMYIRKGWNALGEKFGDYGSIGLFAGKTFFKKLGVTLQLKGEMIGKLSYMNADDLIKYGIVDVTSFGSKKIAFVPQISYSYKTFTVFTMTEIPLYQYVNGTGIASQYLFTLGLSYKFMPFKAKEE
jgi:hypothetical protein